MLAVARSAECDDEISFASIYNIVTAFPDNRLAGQGAVALLAAIAQRDADAVKSFVKSLPDSATTEFIRDEIAWRVE